MSLQPPVSVKQCSLRFLSQAASLDKVHPNVAYFCRLHALQSVMATGSKEREVKQFCGALMTRLEADAAHLSTAVSTDEGQPACEQLALAIFSGADEMDRRGAADKSTAQAFYASSILMEVCTQFGQLSPDLAEKVKYAQFKSADILKALREGRVPTAGSHLDAVAASLAATPPALNSIDEYGVGAAPSAPPLAAMASASSSAGVQFDPYAAPSAHASQAGAAISVHPFTFPSVVPTVGTPPAAAATASASASALVTASFTQHAPPMSFVSLVSSAPVGPRSLTSSDLAAHESKLDTCVIAERLCRHALSSLHFQDVAVAYAKLQEAMLLLKPLVE